MHGQARIGVVQIEAGQLRDALHAIEERVAVDEQFLGRLAQIAQPVKERFQRLDQIAAAFVIQQRPQRLATK